MRKVFMVSLVVGSVLFGASVPASASTGIGKSFHDGLTTEEPGRCSR